MQIRRVRALIDTEGRDISGNRVFMAQGTLHLVSEVDIEYFLARPTIFDVSQDVEIVFYAKDVNGTIIGFELPNGVTLPLSKDIPSILTRLTAIETLDAAQQISIANLQTANVAQDTLIASITSINTTQSAAIATIQTTNSNQDNAILAIQNINTSQSTAIASLQAAVATLQSSITNPQASTITSISSVTANEGATLTHTVILSANTGGTFAFSIANNTTSNTDYTLPPIFSGGVTLSGSNITVPNGIGSFTVGIAAVTDALVEPTETYTLTVGGVPATGTIVNVPVSMTVTSVSSPTAAEGATLTFNIALSGATQQAQLVPFTIGGTATANTDYATPLTFSNGVTISGTNLSVPIGVSSFTASTLTTTDALVEPTETLILTVGGVLGTGSITDVVVSPLTALTDMVAFELPYEMLTAAQRTATAGVNAGGYIGVVASRNSTVTASNAIYLSTTQNGTFTKILDSQAYAGSALLQGAYNYKHTNLSFVDEKDFPTSIATNSMALLYDTAGQQEFVVLPGLPTVVTLAGDTGKTFENVGIGAYYTRPITINQDDTARLYFLSNTAQDSVLRANGTYWLKIVPKDVNNVEMNLALITAIPVTISSKASQPNYPTNIGFNFQGNNFLDPYIRQDDLPSGNTYVRVGHNNRTTTPAGSFYNPSATIESGVSYEMDVVGLNGVGVARTITWDAANNYFFYGESDHLVDGGRYATDYNAYAVKNGIRSLAFPFTVRQLISNQNEAKTLTLSFASNTITAAIGLNTTAPQTALARQERVLIAVTLSGTLLTNIAMSSITPNANALLVSYNTGLGIAVFECAGDTQNFNVNIPYTTGSGKSLTVTAGGVDSTLTQTIAIP